MDAFDEDQDVDGALRYLEIPDLQQRYRDLTVTLMPHVSLAGARSLTELMSRSKYSA